MKYDKNVYVGFDPFENDRDTGITCKKVRLVKTRTLHMCIDEKPHVIKPGSMARYESVIMDNKWFTAYMCTDCIDKILVGIDDHEEK